jgi:hypothetical protein
MHLGAVAVGLDFVEPVVAGLRLLAQGRIAGLDEAGERRLARADNGRK